MSRGIELWAQEVPDLDTSGTEVVGRLVRIAALAHEAIDRVLAPHGIRQRGYAVLAILRTHGAPDYEVPTQVLLDATFLTSGGLTNLLDRLAAQGLVKRRPNPRDRRSIAVRLTPKGRALVEELAPEVGRVERALVAALPQERRAELARLLGALLAEVDPVPISLRRWAAPSGDGHVSTADREAG